MRLYHFLKRQDLRHSEKVAFVAISFSCGAFDCAQHTREQIVEMSGLKPATFDVAIIALKRVGMVSRLDTRPVYYLINPDYRLEGLTEEMSKLLRYKNLMPATKVVGLYALLRETDYSAKYTKIAATLNMSPTTLTNAYKRLVNKGIIHNLRIVGKGQRKRVIRRPMNEWSKKYE